MALKTGLPLELNKPQGTDFFDEQRDIATNMQIINDWAALVEAHRLGTTGEEHALAIAGGRAGFFSGADKAKLDTIEGGAISQANGDLRWLGINAVAVDSAKLGSVLAANFARRDIANTFAALQTFGANLYLNAATGVDGLFRFRANSVDKWDIKFDNATGHLVIRDLVAGRDSAVFSASSGKLNASVGLQEAGTDLTAKYAQLAVSPSFSGGTVTLSNATANALIINAVATGAPTFTTRSAGAKIVLWNNTLTASSANYALGIESNTLWSGVPTTAEQFKWYGGTTLAATLTGTGALTLVAGLTATTGTFSGALSAASATLSGALSAASATLTGGLTGTTANFTGVVDFGNGRIVIDATTASATRANIKIGDGSGWYTKFIRTNDNASIIELIDNVGLNIGNGMKIQHNGTDVLDTSRNLKNIGTVTNTGNVVTANGYHNVRRAGSGDWAFYADVSTDTVSRFAVRADGFIEWGAGGSSARDVNLYRVNAGQLGTDHLFITNRALAADIGFLTRVNADAYGRWAVFAGGTLEWGSGAAARDVNLYRSAADVLKTDDSFVVGADLTVTNSINLTTNAVNHFIREGTGWIWKSTGLTGGTTRGGVWADASGNLRLFGGTTIASDKLTVSVGGNIMVGTATDDGSNKFQVTGNAKVTGAIEATTTATATEVHVKSSATTKRFKLDYNETDDTLDFIYSDT